ENVTTDDSSVLLNVFFSEQNQCVYLRDTIFSTVYLLSSFGGVYSLFLGCSLITVIEVFYYFTVRLTVNMKIFEKATIPSEITKKTKIPSLSQYIPPADNFTMEFLP
uniref:Sodium channel protein Nach-like n=1 Tax=Diabrotica virgifera virgifera TaxID=50390 RepID=A0A6P7H609_DIAVI